MSVFVELHHEAIVIKKISFFGNFSILHVDECKCNKKFAE